MKRLKDIGLIVVVIIMIMFLMSSISRGVVVSGKEITDKELEDLITNLEKKVNDIDTSEEAINKQNDNERNANKETLRNVPDIIKKYLGEESTENSLMWLYKHSSDSKYKELANKLVEIKDNASGKLGSLNVGGTVSGGEDSKIDYSHKQEDKSELANDEFIINTDDYKVQELTTEEAGSALTKAKKILGVIRNIGVVVSVMMLMIIGIKYMLGSVEQKADYKTSLLPYTVGVVLIASGTTIVAIIQSVM